MLTIWVLIFTFTLRWQAVDLVASHGQLLFATQDACEQARPLVLARLDRWMPMGFTVPITAHLTDCMEQTVLSNEAVLPYFEGNTP